jgi:hypothetical protein
LSITIAATLSSSVTGRYAAPPPQPSHGKVARKHLDPPRENLIVREPESQLHFHISPSSA